MKVHCSNHCTKYGSITYPLGIIKKLEDKSVPKQHPIIDYLW